MADLSEIGRLLALRYNVPEVDGDLADALAAGDVDEVERLCAEREMYRWTEPIAQAIAAARGNAEPEPEEAEPEPEEAEAEPVQEPETVADSIEEEEPAPEAPTRRRSRK